MFIIPRDGGFSELYGKVLTIAKSNYIKLSETRLKSTFDMFSHQQSKQQQEDMFISFAAVGILSKLFRDKCVILVKGKTGLFLCADILKKYASASARPAASAPSRGSSSARHRNSAKGGPPGNGGSKRRRRRRTLRKRLR
jgi:hypothetical protein